MSLGVVFMYSVYWWPYCWMSVFSSFPILWLKRGMPRRARRSPGRLVVYMGMAMALRITPV